MHGGNVYVAINLKTRELRETPYLSLVSDKPEILKQQGTSPRTWTGQPKEVSLSSFSTNFC